MATVLFEGVFDQMLLKTAKMTVFSTFCLSLPHILRTIGFFKFSTYSLFIELGSANSASFGSFWLVLVHF